MVHLIDEGSHFDAPIDQVWKYLQSDEDHRPAHKGRRNFQRTALNESSFINSWEQDNRGTWVKIVNKVTPLPPVGIAVEFLEGPMAGSKFFNYYTPRGNRTGVTVVGEFTSAQIPASQLEPAVRGVLQEVFEEDTVALKAFTAKE